MSQRPYLTSELDARYHLVARRDGCFGLWGDIIYRGQYQDVTIDFKPYGFYATGQSDGGPALAMRVTLSSEAIPIVRQMHPWYVHRWLASLTPPRTDLLDKSHPITEIWRAEDTQLSVILVNERGELDLAFVPDCVERLVAVVGLIREAS